MHQPTHTPSDPTLTAPIALAMLPSLKRSEQWLWLLSLCCAAFLFWAGIAPVHETTQAPGEVTPEGKLQVVQHLEGGMLRDIQVEEGQWVDAGQTLMTLNPDAANTPLTEQQEKVLKLGQDLATWRSIANAEPGSDALLASMQAARTEERKVLTEQIRQRQEAVAAADAQIRSARAQVAVAQEALQLQQNLMDKGLGTSSRLLDRKQAATAAGANLAQMQASAQTARAALSESRARLAGMNASQSEEAQKEITRLESELAIAQATLKRLQGQTERLVVRAPVSGLVQGLVVNTPGEVITPGQELLRILPAGRKLEVEARISPTDIGQLHVGQDAFLRFQTYDFTRFGQLKGTLIALSPTTYATPEGQPYYKARISLSQPELPQPDGHKLPILPGMTVDVNILTGEKTVLAYLLKPIHRAVASALQER